MLKRLHVIFMLLASWMLAATAYAAPVRITVGDIGDALSLVEHGDDAEQRWAKVLETALKGSEMQYADNGLLVTSREENVALRGGCNAQTLKYADIDILLKPNSSLSLSMTSFGEAVHLIVDVEAELSSRGRVRQDIGVRLGSCQKVGQDTFDFTATGRVFLQADFAIQLNPSEQAEAIVYAPTIDLVSQSRSQSIDVDVDGTALSVVLEELLKQELEDALSHEKIAEQLYELRDEITAELTASSDSGALAIPTAFLSGGEPALKQALLGERALVYVTDYLATQKTQLLSGLMDTELDTAEDAFKQALTCELVSLLEKPLTNKTLYQQQADGTCAVFTGQGSADVYSNNTCEGNAFSYQASNHIDYCVASLDTYRLGNGRLLPAGGSSWNPSIGNRLDVLTKSFSSQNTQPFVKSITYREVGECQLEMRVYKADPSSQNTKALLAFHGGSWAHRGFGIVGIEATITDYLQAGYSVFLPFYRLAGTSEATSDCHDVTLDAITEDAEAALQWVQSHAPEYGVDASKVYLLGQSAGALLAADLSIRFPESIAKAVLFYPPLDFEDYVLKQGVGDASEDGLRILSKVLKKDVDSFTSDANLLARYTYTSHVAANPAQYPPMLMLHGMKDELVPARQSIRMCGAYSGDVNHIDAAALFQNQAVVEHRVCGDSGQSELYLFKEADHALDFCLTDAICTAGSKESQQAVAEALQQAQVWMSRVSEKSSTDQEVEQNVANTTSSGSSGGGVLGYWIVLLIGLWLWRTHWRRKAI